MLGRLLYWLCWFGWFKSMPVLTEHQLSKPPHPFTQLIFCSQLYIFTFRFAKAVLVNYEGFYSKISKTFQEKNAWISFIYKKNKFKCWHSNKIIAVVYKEKNASPACDNFSMKCFSLSDNFGLSLEWNSNFHAAALPLTLRFWETWPYITKERFYIECTGGDWKNYSLFLSL